MVPISKQPKEKIQAIIESCSRQFPEFQERSRKRIRTYLKSCRRMKKGGFEVNVSNLRHILTLEKQSLTVFHQQIRPTPPHLTSAIAENILAAACDSESRNAAKRMRLDTYPATVNVGQTSTEPQFLISDERREYFFSFSFWTGRADACGQVQPEGSRLRSPIRVLHLRGSFCPGAALHQRRPQLWPARVHTRC